MKTGLYLLVVILGMGVSSATTYLVVGGGRPAPAACDADEACAVCSQQVDDSPLYQKRPNAPRSIPFSERDLPGGRNP